MVKLRWLQVNKFRSVKPGTRLTFNDGYNVLLGQNGTGKTTLLNLVAAVVRSDFTEFMDVGFDLKYELVSESGSAVFAVRNEHRLPLLQAALEASPQEALRLTTLASGSSLPTHAFSAQIDLTTPQAPPLQLNIKDSRVSIQNTDPASTDIRVEFGTTTNQTNVWSVAASALAQWDTIPAPGWFRAWFSLSEPQVDRFDESLEHFEHLGNIELEVYRTPDGSVVPLRSKGPLKLTIEFLDVVQKQWGATRYTIRAEHLPFLSETVRLLDFERAEASIELQQTDKLRDPRAGEPKEIEWAKLGNLRFFFIYRSGSMIIEKHLSYGQKRMLAFMHYLATAESIAIVDELVNGLHHRWIRACFEALGQRQVFLTSQNPLLLDYLNFQSPEDVRSTFVLCTWEKSPEQMVWENMTQAAAEDFFASYKVGFQQVGELLQSKGLW